RQIEETSCTARPDHTLGSGSTKLKVSTTSPLLPKADSDSSIGDVAEGQELTWCGSRLSLRQPSFAQAFGISCHAFRPTTRGSILEVGDALRWPNLTQALHHLSRPLHSPSERVGHGGPAQCQMKVRVLSQGLFGVRCRLVVAAGEHMSKSNSTIREGKNL